MSVNEALRIVRLRWRVVLLCVLLGLIGAGVAGALTPREYSANITVYVSLQGRADSADAAYQGGRLAAERVVSYAPLMRDERITQAVVDRLKLPMTAGQLAQHLTVDVEPDTTVLKATVTDDSPDRAAAIANAVGEEFVGLVSQLEQPIVPTAKPPLPGQPAQPAAEPTRIGAQVVRPSTPSPIPTSTPNLPFGLSLGAALGLLVGVGAAFLRNSRDTMVRDPERLHVLTSVPVLAEIPSDRGAGNYPIAVDQAPPSSRAEAYRRLRTNLQFRDGDEPGHVGSPKVIVVTSAGSGEGTSLTACNLARALADSGSRVLLIDANLRRPRVETYLDLDPGPGLTTVLTGRLRLPSVLRRMRDVPLEILPSGPVAPRPGELLAWRGMAGLLHEVRQRYDFVIVDVPALLPVSDAATVAARADGVVLVVRYGKTSEEQVAAATDALEAVSARLLGTVLNMTRTQRRNARAYPAYHGSLLALPSRPNGRVIPERPLAELPRDGASRRPVPKETTKTTGAKPEELTRTEEINGVKPDDTTRIKPEAAKPEEIARTEEINGVKPEEATGTKTEATKTEATKTEATKTEATKTEATKTESTKTEDTVETKQSSPQQSGPQQEAASPRKQRRPSPSPRR